MRPGSWEKRFVNQLYAIEEPCELTPKQAEWVETLAHRFRFQIGKLTGATDK